MPYAKHHCHTCGADEAEAEFLRFDGYIQAVVFTCLGCSITSMLS